MRNHKQSIPHIEVILLLSLLIPGCASSVYAETNVVFYPVNPDHQSDGMVSGAIEGRPVEFEYQHTYHFSSEGEKDFKANYVRLAADGELDVTLEINAEITEAYLKTLGKDLPFDRRGSRLQFTLPGPGKYYLQLPDLNTPGRITYTVFFFVDDLNQYKEYQYEFQTAKDVTQFGISSSIDKDQTQQIQALINLGGAVFFPQGIYRTGQLTIPSNTTLFLDTGAVLKATDDYNESRFIHIEDARNTRIAGLGVIDANGNAPGNQPSKGHLIDMESCEDIQLDGIVFRNSNSWMIHIRRSGDIRLEHLHLFSGKDGIDPDGSSDVEIEDVTIQSIDDAFAIKSKFEGENCERVTMMDCIVFSCASSLKVGTENYHGVIQDIIWDNCDVVDADRGIILYTNENGAAPICNITWRNIRIFNFDWEFEKGGAPFQFENRKGNEGGDVTNILVQNVVAFPKTDVAVKHEAGAVQVTFQNVIVHGKSKVDDTRHMTFKGIIWDGVTSEPLPVVFIEPSKRLQNHYRHGDDITASVLHPHNSKISKVEWFINGRSQGIDTNSPFTYRIEDLDTGNYTVSANATDENGRANQSSPSRIKIVPAN